MTRPVRAGEARGPRTEERLAAVLGADPFAREAIRREADRLRREGEGENPTVAERLAAERVVVAWLYVAWRDLWVQTPAVDREDRGLTAHVSRLRNFASRHDLHALRSVTLLRKAGAGTGLLTAPTGTGPAEPV